MNRLTPLRIWGPSAATKEMGAQYIMDKMYDMYEWDRNTRSGVIDARGMVLEITEFDHRAAKQVVYESNGVVIRSFLAADGATSSVAYGLEWNGLKFAYAGSTKGSQTWIDYAKGADIVLHESWLPTKEGAPAQYHASPALFGEVMAEIQPRLAMAFHFKNDQEHAQTVRQGIAQNYHGALVLAADYLTVNISKESMGVRLGKEDREIWPTPPVKVKAAEPDKLKLIRLLTGYSQAGVLTLPEVITPIYDEMNAMHGTDYSPILTSFPLRAVKKLRIIGRAITSDDPSKQ
jgi:ribonuclease Z